MRRAVLPLFGILALAVAALAPPAAAQGRFAVVIGAESYSDAIGAAPGARDDARHVAQALGAEGYVVQLLEDPDEATLKRSVYDLVDRLNGAGADAVGVFYFAGQGVQINGDAFLLPVDARATDDLTVSASGLSGELVFEQLDAVAGATSLIVLDAASPNALTARFSLVPGIAPLDPPGNGLVIFSHYPDQVALPRQEGVSVFARAFGAFVHDRAADFGDALGALRRTVSEESGGTRYVWISGDLPASFTLSARSAASPAGGSRSLSGAGAPAAAAPAPMPVPAEPAAEEAEAREPVHVVDVFFGTDRVVREREGVPEFTAESARRLTYGIAHVSIPPKHESGQLESPAWWRFEFAPDPEKHVVFRGASLRDQDQFFAELRGVVAESDAKQAFVFIHGFSVPFADAARRTAQMHHDLGFDGAPIFYSWPSEGSSSPLAYAHDGNAVDRSAPMLERFLMEVADRTGAEKIHLIAHSMGNRALIAALDEIAEDLAREGRAAPFAQVIMSAPDIDRDVFLNVAEEILPTAQRVSLYASANDAALKLSKELNGNPRAGDSSGSVVIVDGLNTIDASDVRTELFDLGHDYFGDDDSILHDIGALMATNADPPERGLVERLQPPGAEEYWAILRRVLDRE